MANSGPSFYLTGRQPLSPGAIVLAVAGAAVGLSLVMFALNHSGHPGSEQDDDDPNQVDTIVIGDPGEAPKPAKPGEKVSSVHPTILVHLPRWGNQLGLIPDSRAGHLLFNWLAAFNKANASGLAEALPNIAVESTTAIQMELRRQTGGFSLLSAKEVQPGVLVFRMRDQTPAGMEVLGTLQVRAKSDPAEIESFSLRAVPPPVPAAVKDATVPQAARPD